MMRVLSVTSEAVPWVKTGGLADVAGTLPAALRPLEIEVKTLLPGYADVLSQMRNTQVLAEIPDCIGGPVKILQAQVGQEAEPAALEEGDCSWLILDAPHFFNREGSLYQNAQRQDWIDNPERFAALCWAACAIANGLLPGWQPDIVHGHDWQAGLTPYYLSKSPAAERVKSILTIHNIAFQGTTSADKLSTLRLDPQDFYPDRLEYYGQISTLKAGLKYATWITTVSTTYAEELLTPEFGMGMEGVLQSRRGHISGILNGIDPNEWNPEQDTAIQVYHDPAGKQANKRALQQEFGLMPTSGPLCVVVSRLTWQKGLDILLQALPELLARGGQLLVLGSGEPHLEESFRHAAQHPQVAVHLGYDEALSHRLIAGGDAIIIPSRFEPCGLTQLYALRYGTVPLVALTGGLADTVIPATPATLAKHNVATGIQFYPVTQPALTSAIQRLCDLYAQPDRWQQIQLNAMSHPVYWHDSAVRYAKLYQDILTL